MDAAGPIVSHADDYAAAIGHALDQRFPSAGGHVALGPDDCDVTPEKAHPAFWGCLDWHSSAHMQASALILLETGLSAGAASGLTRRLNHRLTAEKVGIEVAYLAAHPGFERPYGWGWATLLAARAARSPVPDAAAWASALKPLTELIFAGLLAWLPRLAYPVRSGVHDNTAFALGLSLDAAGALGRPDVRQAITAWALDAYADDRDYPASWEPSGSDFLSAALCEADLMRRVLPADEFGGWLRGFLPGLGASDDPLLTVPEVRDQTDGKAVHLYGLALSRAAMLRRLTPWLDADAAARIEAATAVQAASAQAAIVAGDFMSTHWLVSFALLERLTD